MLIKNKNFTKKKLKPFYKLNIKDWWKQEWTWNDAILLIKLKSKNQSTSS